MGNKFEDFKPSEEAKKAVEKYVVPTGEDAGRLRMDNPEAAEETLARAKAEKMWRLDGDYATGAIDNVTDNKMKEKLITEAGEEAAKYYEQIQENTPVKIRAREEFDARRKEEQRPSDERERILVEQKRITEETEDKRIKEEIEKGIQEAKEKETQPRKKGFLKDTWEKSKIAELISDKERIRHLNDVDSKKNKYRYEQYMLLQNDIKKDFENCDPRTITAESLMEKANLLQKWELRGKRIMNVSYERALKDNAEWDEAKRVAIESGMKEPGEVAERDVEKLKEIRRRIQGLD
jgi:muconolactone delta-isomerase